MLVQQRSPCWHQLNYKWRWQLCAVPVWSSSKQCGSATVQSLLLQRASWAGWQAQARMKPKPKTQQKRTKQNNNNNKSKSKNPNQTEAKWTKAKRMSGSMPQYTKCFLIVLHRNAQSEGTHTHTQYDCAYSPIGHLCLCACVCVQIYSRIYAWTWAENTREI